MLFKNNIANCGGLGIDANPTPETLAEVAPLQFSSLGLINPKKCLALMHQLRWGETVICQKCGSHPVFKRGFDDIQSDLHYLPIIALILFLLRASL